MVTKSNAPQVPFAQTNLAPLTLTVTLTSALTAFARYAHRAHNAKIYLTSAKTKCARFSLAPTTLCATPSCALLPPLRLPNSAQCANTAAATF